MDNAMIEMRRRDQERKRLEDLLSSEPATPEQVAVHIAIATQPVVYVPNDTSVEVYS